jgi:thioredoxin reductase (NADPH)
VVGGGNSAVADALILARIAKKVILVHRRDTLRAEKVYLKALQEAQNLELRWNSVVSQVTHEDRVNGVVLKDVHSGAESELPCDAVFVSVGRIPNTQLLKGQVDLDSHGYAAADESCRTNIPGVFAVGDVRTKALRQIVTAAADGAVSVHYAEEYLAALY